MDLYEIFRRLKILPIYLFIKVFHMKLQNRIQLMETPVTQAMYYVDVTEIRSIIIIYQIRL